MCVYLVTNIKNNKVYIGKTEAALIYRIRRHCGDAKKGINRYFCDAIRCHGWDNFTVEIIETCSSVTELDNREMIWIAYYKSNEKNFGYNMTAGGDGGKFSPESLKKSADLRRGKPISDEVKKKISDGNKGKKSPKSEEQRAKISAALKGKMPSKPIHEIMIGKPGARLGKTHSQESKDLMSKNQRGKKRFTDKQKIEISKRVSKENNTSWKEISKEELENFILGELTLAKIATHFKLSPATVIEKIKYFFGFGGLNEARNNLLGLNKKIGSRLNINQVKEIKKKLLAGSNYKDLAMEYNIHCVSIRKIELGKSWKDA